MPYPRTFPRLAIASLTAFALAGCATTAPSPTAGPSVPANVESVVSNPAPAPSQTVIAPPDAPRNTSRPAVVVSQPAAAPASPTGSAAQQGMRPFADVIKDAKVVEGLFRVWTKDDRTWLEIQPEQFGKLYFLSSSLNQGIGEARLYGGMMVYPAGLSHPIELRRMGNLVQIIAKNVKYTATAGTP